MPDDRGKHALRWDPAPGDRLGRGFWRCDCGEAWSHDRSPQRAIDHLRHLPVYWGPPDPAERHVLHVQEEYKLGSLANGELVILDRRHVRSFVPAPR